ncbi:MAG: hypothetical protein VX421_02420, partial [Pseudomonadota bacterium]|nr:hypothetical protein [Pseudomonadota bacterium]
MLQMMKSVRCSSLGAQPQPHPKATEIVVPDVSRAAGAGRDDDGTVRLQSGADRPQFQECQPRPQSARGRRAHTNLPVVAGNQIQLALVDKQADDGSVGQQGAAAPSMHWKHFSHALAKTAHGTVNGGRESLVIEMVKCLPQPTLYLLYSTVVEGFQCRAKFEGHEDWLLVVLTLLPKETFPKFLHEFRGN